MSGSQGQQASGQNHVEDLVEQQVENHAHGDAAEHAGAPAATEEATHEDSHQGRGNHKPQAFEDQRIDDDQAHHDRDARVGPGRIGLGLFAAAQQQPQTARADHGGQQQGKGAGPDGFVGEGGFEAPALPGEQGSEQQGQQAQDAVVESHGDGKMRADRDGGRPGKAQAPGALT
ncbi:hypothetical protein AZ34_10900 [Hylemonella gracilis str. Niagara R]|uniref:Uncharacterized protein n=1 Tax=Hylemonella gracilis str. Niagara R TaxID=1458275 RepID=A0A016XK20_9BURK|nr:hypothetical protein AZ34_10900 [Hylemonella gracilis str. Niagara R]